MHATLILHAICCLALRALDSAKKISALNLLLPLSSETQVEFLLEAFNGCYRFASSDSQTLSIAALDAAGQPAEACSARAAVRVEAASASRAVTWLTAADEASGAVLRCEARVAAIRRLEVVTRLRTIDVGNLETVEVVAFDGQGNCFSSLEGLKFQWAIGQAEPLAEFLSFRNSGFQASAKRQKIEDLSGQSDQVVVRGIKTGKIQLVVSYSDSKFEKVKASVDLFIIEHIIIRPEKSLTLLKCSESQIRFYRLVGEKGKRRAGEILQPETRFSAKISPTNLIELSPQMKIRAGEIIGSALITISDLQNPETNLLLNISVAEPENFDIVIKHIAGEDWHDWVNRLTFSPKINFFEQPHDFAFKDNWASTEGEVYIIKPFVKSRDGSEFHLEGEALKWEINPADLEIIHDNNFFIIVKTKKAGTTQISVSIQPKNCRTTSLKSSKELTIYTKIRIVVPRNQQNESFLPSPRQTLTPQILLLEAVGGSENYIWELSEEGVAKIINANQLIASQNGRVTVKCRDALNYFNDDQFILVIEDIAKIEVFEKRQEGELGANVYSFFRAVGVSDQPFANCTLAHVNATAEQLSTHSASNSNGNDSRHKNFNVSMPVWNSKSGREFLHQYLKDQISELPNLMFSNHWLHTHTYFANIGQNEAQNLHLASAILAYKAASLSGVAVFNSEIPGLFVLRLNFPHGPLELVHIRVYQPFSVFYPEDYNKAIFGENPMISFGNSLRMAIKGGPKAWEDSPEPSLAISLSDSQHFSLVTSSQNSSNGIDIFFECKPENLIPKANLDSNKLKDFKKEVIVFVSSSNAAINGLLFPLVTKTSFVIICGQPSQVKLFQINERSNKNYKFLQSHKQRLLLRNEKAYNFVYWNFDSLNLPYFNFTFVPNKVSAEGTKPTPFDSFTEIDQSLSESFSQDSKSENEALSPRILSSILLHGSILYVLSLNSNVGKIKLNAKLQLPNIISNDTITITSTKKLAIEPKSSQLLLSADNEGELSILNGSGNFRVWSEDPSLLSTTHHPNTKAIKLKPLGKGKVKVWVEDLGLESPLRAYADIEIVGFESLFVSLDKRQIQKGDSIQAVISGSKVLKAQLAQTDIRLSASPKTGLSISKLEPTVFAITADEEGEFNIVAEINNTVIGKSALLIVYPVLRFFPERLIMMSDCDIFFRLIGGPGDLFTADYAISITGAENLGSLTLIHPGTYKLTSEKGSKIGRIVAVVKAVGGNQEAGIVAKAEALAEIVFPDALAVHGPYHLLQGASGFLQIFPTNRGRPFSPSFCDFRFIIESLPSSLISHEHIISVIPLSGGREKSGSHFLAQIKAQIPGHDLLSIQLVYTGSHLGLAAIFPIRANFTIAVYENIEMANVKFLDDKVPPCSTIFGNGMLILPINSALALPPRAIASIMPHDHVVAVNDGSRLLAGSGFGFDTLVIQDTESKAKSLVVVKVEAPSFIVLEDIAKIAYMHPSEVKSVPLRYMDAWGRLFAHPLSLMPMEILVSNPNIANVNYDARTGKLSLQSKSNGKVILFIQSLIFSKLSLTVTIIVGTMLLPQSNIVLHSGGEVKLRTLQESQEIPALAIPQTPIATPREASHSPDKWVSSNSAVAEVDPLTGHCRAKKPGNATVTFQSAISPKAEIQVVEISTLAVDSSNPSFISNIPSHKNYQQKYVFKFVPTFTTEVEKLTLGPLVNQNLHYNCTVNSKMVFARKSGSEEGDFGCELGFLAARGEIPQSLVLTINVWSSTTSFQIEESVNIKVITAFHSNLIGDRIQLNKNERASSFDIRSSSKLTISPDPQLKPFVKSTFFPGNSTQRVFLHVDEGVQEALKGKVEILNPDSGQRQIVGVVFEPKGSFWSNFSFSLSTDSELTFSDLVVIFICIMILLFIIKELRQRKVTEEDREYNTISRMSNSRSLNYSTPRNPF